MSGRAGDPAIDEMQNLKMLLEGWQHEGIPLHAAEPALNVQRAFERAGGVATADVIALYSVLGGMDDVDREYWRLWTLSEVERENGGGLELGSLFSDYLLGCWCYRLKPNNRDTSSVYVDYFDAREPTRVAGSLKEFFDAYAANPVLLLDPASLSATDDRHI